MSDKKPVKEPKKLRKIRETSVIILELDPKAGLSIVKEAPTATDPEGEGSPSRVFPDSSKAKTWVKDKGISGNQYQIVRSLGPWLGIKEEKKIIRKLV